MTLLGEARWLLVFCLERDLGLYLTPRQQRGSSPHQCFAEGATSAGIAATVRRCFPCGFAALWLFSSRRQALTLLEHCTIVPALPNVRAKRATTAGRQARAGENVQRTTGPGLVACRWRSA